MNVAAAVRKPLIAISLAILLAFSALAQTATPPDLSGSWVLNLAKSKLGKHATIGSETIVITCPNSTIQFHNTTDGKESTVIYIPDGKEHIVKQISDSQIFSKAQWKKSVLVTESGGRIVGGAASGVEPINIKSRWTLSADGRVLTQEMDDPRQVFVYDKQ